VVGVTPEALPPVGAAKSLDPVGDRWPV